MDRRTCLKTSLLAAGGLLVPTGVLGLVGCSGTVQTPDLVGFNGKIMGTGYSVRLGGTELGKPQLPQDSPQFHKLVQQVQAVLQDVDANMSTWRADSELSALNDSVNTDWQLMTPQTAQVIATALETSRSSSGAFDATIGPLVDLWGFGAGAVVSNDNDRMPAARAIRENMARVGSGAIEVDLDANAVRKQRSDARLDLSGIAKGHAVDRVASVLEAEGIVSYLVEVGGELKSRGSKPDGSPWKVAIEKPLAGRRDVFRSITLGDRAIATSGDYRNFFANGGQRYSHSIDPRTGQPVSHELASVSVVAESTMAADALSTALMIMGPADAFLFAERHQVAAHLILKSGSSLKEEYTTAFEPWLS